jgi:hypothetical protein
MSPGPTTPYSTGRKMRPNWTMEARKFFIYRAGNQRLSLFSSVAILPLRGIVGSVKAVRPIYVSVFMLAYMTGDKPHSRLHGREIFREIDRFREESKFW